MLAGLGGFPTGKAAEFRPGEICIKAMSLCADDVRAGVGCAGCSIVLLNNFVLAIGGFQREDFILGAVDDDQGPGSNQPAQVPHVKMTENSRNIVAGTVVLHANRRFIATEGTGRHDGSNALIHGGSINARRSAAGIAHNGDAACINLREMRR